MTRIVAWGKIGLGIVWPAGVARTNIPHVIAAKQATLAEQHESINAGGGVGGGEYWRLSMELRENGR